MVAKRTTDDFVDDFHDDGTYHFRCLEIVVVAQMYGECPLASLFLDRTRPRRAPGGRPRRRRS